ncbi:G-D-S-L family lipolytic protein [Niveispirillum sp. SYP-B3756]|uniref:rhamnogalacturonan acetylesterase n=1 Tax=Niveispirillum sp. SYP-B3756 TaxID=2662178 RepID=UPI0012915895|nr:rhamnogalacturonan acetylesterase [Niveispirillum sp. SYP-B3756]MQP65276.1 G-D-S-L family lipolytic protein [Niveispirillum sp. SYP-B3756]
MKAKKFAALALGSLLLTGPALAEGKIFIAGDSTAASYKPDRFPQMGWGMVLKCSLDASQNVVNRAMGGRSTKTFIGEGRFDAIAKDISTGDTLLIQFGHNDANDKKPERYTPIPEFKTNLLRFIAMAREKGATPVLITPVAIRRFDEKGAIGESLTPYANATREVAYATATPLVDLNYDSRVYMQKRGVEPSKAYYLHYPKEAGYKQWPDGVSDDVHFSEKGARAVAALVAGRLKALGLPVSTHVTPLSPDDPAVLGNDACAAS